MKHLITCKCCNKTINNDDKIVCDECFEAFCEDCIIENFDNIYLCKECANEEITGQ